MENVDYLYTKSTERALFYSHFPFDNLPKAVLCMPSYKWGR